MPPPPLPLKARFDEWQLSVLEYHKSVRVHQHNEFVFCPIIGRYFRPREMAVIRLVPLTEESHHIAYQFGKQDDVEEDRQIIESVENGLVMYQPFADRFLDGELMIIPLKRGESLKLRVTLLNEIIGMCTIPGFRYRYGDLNYKTLEIKDECLPDFRCLHWRYIINLERATNRSWLNVERAPKWGLRGPFMRKGIVRRMDLSWGRRGIPNETAFADTIWDGVDPEDAELDRVIASALERSTRGNRSGSENSRSQSGQPQYTSGNNAVSASNQGVPASSVASGAMPGAFGPIGTMPRPA